MNIDKLIKAIHQVETGGRLGPTLGDGGRALGPLQIHRVAWIDARQPGSYEHCADLDYSAAVFRAYIARYAVQRRIGHAVTAEDIARIWNGGPNGYRKSSTLKYWKKVKAHYEH